MSMGSAQCHARLESRAELFFIKSESRSSTQVPKNSGLGGQSQGTVCCCQVLLWVPAVQGEAKAKGAQLLWCGCVQACDLGRLPLRLRLQRGHLRGNEAAGPDLAVHSALTLARPCSCGATCSCMRRPRMLASYDTMLLPQCCVHAGMRRPDNAGMAGPSQH